jgi:superfamily II DNA helicase RecQ
MLHADPLKFQGDTLTANGDILLLASELKRYFGFERFRAGQEPVVRDALAGRDVLALMPTGGGKSLCFQLPALLQPSRR